MSGFFNAVSACLVVLLLMAVGYFMGVKGWMTAAEKNFLSRFIINIAVPANCIVGLLNNLDRAELARAGVQLLSVLFIGIPVCTQLFGDVCVPYVMLYYLGNTTFLQSAGILLVERSGDRGERSEGPGRFLRDMFTKPPILGVLLAIALLLLDVTPPGPVMRFTGYISSTVSPLALIYGGFIVYEVGLKNLRFLRGLPTMLVIRLAVAPVICWGCCRLFGLDGLVRNVFLVESALPVVSQVTVMAGAYGADEEYAATGACLSIFGCFVTLPFWILFIG